MTDINLGVRTVDGVPVTMSLDRLLTTRMLVQANSGGGKSWALRRILEQTHGKVQHLVIDPEGEFSSLRERFDYVLAAKAGGDTVADPRSARLLAERLLELNVSAILDIYELKAHERIAFVKHFLEALVDAPKKLWHPALVVVDEAHVYCPEKGDAESAGAVIDLSTRGRKRGFCPIYATQRIAKLRKDAAAEANNKLIGRASLDVDMERAAGELGLKKADWPTLRSLKEGTFLSFGPAFTVRDQVFAMKVGSVMTTHPEAGSRIAFTPPPPTAKIVALLPKLSDLPAEAAERAHTIDDLRKEVSRLKSDLTVARKAAPGLPVPMVREVPVLEDAHVKGLEKEADRLVRAVVAIQSAAADVDARAKEITSALASVRDAQRVAAGRTLAADGRAAAAHFLAARPSPVTHRDSSPDGLSGPEQRILDAMAWLESLGQAEMDQTAVAFLAGYTVGGGAFNNPRGALNTRGLIRYRNGRLALTDEGRKAASFPEEVLTSDELHRRVMDRLPGPEQRILKVVLEEYPNSIQNDSLARAAGYEPGGGAFNNPRGRLRTMGLIDYPEKGSVRASDILFLER